MAMTARRWVDPQDQINSLELQVERLEGQFREARAKALQWAAEEQSREAEKHAILETEFGARDAQHAATHRECKENASRSARLLRYWSRRIQEGAL